MSVPNGYALASASFTRPADTTAYASGDLVANSTTAGSVVAMTLAVGNGPVPCRIRRVRLSKTKADVTAASFRVHLYSVLAITNAVGDNSAISTNGAASYHGQVDVTVSQLFTDGAQGAATTDIIIPSGANCYALLEARGAYTPASAEVFTLGLEVEQG